MQENSLGFPGPISTFIYIYIFSQHILLMEQRPAKEGCLANSENRDGARPSHIASLPQALSGFLLPPSVS